MTNSPDANIGEVLEVSFEHPHVSETALEEVCAAMRNLKEYF